MLDRAKIPVHMEDRKRYLLHGDLRFFRNLRSLYPRMPCVFQYLVMCDCCNGANDGILWGVVQVHFLGGKEVSLKKDKRPAKLAVHLFRLSGYDVSSRCKPIKLWLRPGNTIRHNHHAVGGRE